MLVDGTLKCICAKIKVESFSAKGKICSQTSNVESNNLAQGDSRDVCQQEAYAFGGLGQTPKVNKLGSCGI
jgi:hypothetical protein